MGWWSTPPGNAVSQPDGYDETQGKMSDTAWVSGDGTIVSILKKIAGAGGTGGGPATIADGADVAQGTTTDAASSSTVIGLLKNLKAALAGKLLITADPITFAVAQHVIVDTAPSTVVTGPLTDVQLRASAPHVIVDSGTLGSVTINGVPHVILDSATIAALTDGTLRGTVALSAGAAVIGHVIVDSGTLGSVTINGVPHVIIDSATLGTVVTTDVAAEASLATLVADTGVPTSDSPGAFTVLDQLSRIRKAEEQSSKALAALLALQTPIVRKPTSSTLLHRS